jgi:DNA-binding XRE family transcriptional regulator
LYCTVLPLALEGVGSQPRIFPVFSCFENFPASSLGSKPKNMLHLIFLVLPCAVGGSCDIRKADEIGGVGGDNRPIFIRRAVLEQEWTVATVRQSLRKIRIERGLRAQDVAKVMKISRPFYTQLESGARGLTMRYFLRFTKAFDIDPGVFFEGEPTAVFAPSAIKISKSTIEHRKRNEV